MLRDWLRDFHIAQQTLETAESSDQVVDALREILTWLLGERTSIEIILDVAAAMGRLPYTAKEAVETLTPHADDSAGIVALPLVVGDELHGLAVILTHGALDPCRAGLASTLAYIAASTLSRLSWPASPKIFRQLVENANVAIDVAALDGTITYANRAAANLYGFDSPADMIGRNVSEHYYGDEEQRISNELIRQSRTQAGWSGDVSHKTVDGRPMPVRLAVFPMRDHQNRMTSFGAIAQSLGEQQRLLYSVQRHARRLRAAAEVTNVTISRMELETLIPDVAEVTQALFNYDLVAVLLVEGDALHPYAIYTPQGRLQTTLPPTPLSADNLNSRVVTTGQAELAEDYQSGEGLTQHRGLQHDILAVRSELVLPMRLGQEVIGTLNIQSTQAHAFLPEDIETLQSIADQLAVAINNARLFESQRSQVKQLAALNRISQLLVAAYSLDDLWPQIYAQIVDLFNVKTFYVMLYDAPTDMLTFVYLIEDGHVLEPQAPHPANGLSGYVVRSGKAFNVTDLHTQLEALEAQGIRPVAIQNTDPSRIRSWLGVPLRARDGTILGLICVQSEQPTAFGPAEEQLLSTVATQISLAMENARLFNQLSSAAMQLKERARRLESLYKVGTLLSSSLDRNQILTRAAEQIVKLLKVDHCGITLIDEKAGCAELVAEYPPMATFQVMLPIQGNPILENQRTPDVFVSSDVEHDPRMKTAYPVLSKLGVKSIMVARLVSKGKVIGSIGVDSIKARREFTFDETETLRTLATQVSLAVDNADLYAQALAANELKSQFLATMSHELRTPLNAVMGYTEMVMGGVYGELNPTQKDRLQRVYSNAQHLLDLINDILDLAKIESGRLTLNPEPIAVQPLLETALSHITPLAEAKRLRLEASYAPELPTVNADTIRLRQIMINLLSNAVKFTREGGITVTASLLAVPDASLPEGIQLPNGQWVCVRVTDTGIGIARENFEMIFDAFRQVDGSAVREYPGTGLGLSITRHLVELHGGKLWLESEVGRGSTFSVAFPALPTQNVAL